MIRGDRIDERVFDYYARLDRVRRFVVENPQRTIRLADAADVAGLETKYFSTFFRQKVGMRFTEWLTYLRVRRAQRLLSQRNHSILGVARQVGYGDLRTFERAFRRCTGETPRQFKSRARPG